MNNNSIKEQIKLSVKQEVRAISPQQNTANPLRISFDVDTN